LAREGSILPSDSKEQLTKSDPIDGSNTTLFQNNVKEVSKGKVSRSSLMEEKILSEIRDNPNVTIPSLALIIGLERTSITKYL
jgi:hypothetical protein